jgi:hypothetical protein
MFMDATHGMQQYGFKLVTLHVQNEQHKGEGTPFAKQYWQTVADRI